MTTLDELRAMDDAAFNRAVAELVGWTNIRSTLRLKSGWIYGSRDEFVGTSPDGDEDYHIPDYATDLNAAWALMPIQANVYLSRRAETPTHVAGISRVGAAIEYNGEHERPARALATAWYAWKLAQEARS